MKLFDVPKVGLYLDTITHSSEKRAEAEVKIVSLVLRVQPFDSRLAASLPEGVKPTLFSLNTGDPKEALRRVDFTLGVQRQNLLVHAAPDTDAPSISFQQARIWGTYARTEKGMRGFAFIFKATFGPLGPAELAYIQEWHLSQRFVSFELAEPGMFDDEAEPEDDPAPSGSPAPMFDDDGAEINADAANRPLHSHQRRGRRKSVDAPEPVGAAAE